MWPEVCFFRPEISPRTRTHPNFSSTDFFREWDTSLTDKIGRGVSKNVSSSKKLLKACTLWLDRKLVRKASGITSNFFFDFFRHMRRDFLRFRSALQTRLHLRVGSRKHLHLAQKFLEEYWILFR